MESTVSTKVLSLLLNTFSSHTGVTKGRWVRVDWIPEQTMWRVHRPGLKTQPQWEHRFSWRIWTRDGCTDLDLRHSLNENIGSHTNTRRDEYSICGRRVLWLANRMDWYGPFHFWPRFLVRNLFSNKRLEYVEWCANWEGHLRENCHKSRSLSSRIHWDHLHNMYKVGPATIFVRVHHYMNYCSIILYLRTLQITLSSSNRLRFSSRLLIRSSTFN
jgi:hypothetical protein